MSFLHQRKLPNRFEIQADTFKRFTWRERLKILIGYNLIVRVSHRVDKRSGQSWLECLPGLTPLKTEKDVVEDLRKFDVQQDLNAQQAIKELEKA